MSSLAPTTRTLLTGAALLALWGLSLGLSYVSLGALALPVALVIAAVKAGLVIFMFMELARESASMIYAFAIGLMMVALLMAFVIADVMTRAPSPI